MGFAEVRIPISCWLVLLTLTGSTRTPIAPKTPKVSDESTNP